MSKNQKSDEVLMLTKAIDKTDRHDSCYAKQCLLVYAGRNEKKSYLDRVLSGKPEDLRSSYIAPYLLSFCSRRYIENAIERLLTTDIGSDVCELLINLMDCLVIDRRRLRLAKHLLFKYMLDDKVASNIQDHDYIRVWRIISDMVCIHQYCNEGVGTLDAPSNAEISEILWFSPEEAVDFIERFVRANRSRTYRDMAFGMLSDLAMPSFINMNSVRKFCDHMSDEGCIRFVLPLVRKYSTQRSY